MMSLTKMLNLTFFSKMSKNKVKKHTFIIDFFFNQLNKKKVFYQQKHLIKRVQCKILISHKNNKIPFSVCFCDFKQNFSFCNFLKGLKTLNFYLFIYFLLLFCILSLLISKICNISSLLCFYYYFWNF